MKCGPTIDRRKVSKERQADYAKVEQMVDLIKNDPRVRMALGIPIGEKTNAKYDFAAWVQDRLMMDPLRERMTSADVNQLFAEMVRIRDTINRAKGFASRSHFKAWLHRMIYLPQVTFSRDFIRGEDLFLSTQILKHRADGKRTAMIQRLDGLGESFHGISKVTMREVDRTIDEGESRLTQELDHLRILEQSPSATNTEKRQARIRVEDARQALQRIHRGEVEDKALGRALRLQRAVVLALQGQFAEVDAKTGREVIRPMALEEVMTEIPTGPEMAEGATTKSKRRVTREGFARAMRKALPDIDWKTQRSVDGLVNEVSKFLSDFGEVAREGFEAEKGNLIHELTRGEAMLPEAEAKRAVEKMTKFDQVELYFPRKALSHISRLNAIVNGLKTASDARAYLRNVIRHGDQVIFKGEGTPHLRERSLDRPQRDVSMNLFRVVQDYASDMINYWHDNRLSLKLNRYIEQLWDVRRSLPAADGEAFEGYIRGVSDYLVQSAETSKNSPTGGKLEEISKTMIAAKAGVTMGFLNPSTPLLNLAEGQALIWTRAGADYMSMSGSRRQLWNNEIQRLVKDEFTEILPEEQLMQYGEGTESKLLRSMSPQDAKRHLMVEKDTNLLRLQRLRKATSEAAKRAIVLQTKAENINRTKAFRIGATMEYEYIQGKMQPLIMSRDASKLITDAQIRSMFGKDRIPEIRRRLKGSEQDRQGVWEEFARSRVIKAGYEFMYQTQWNYNQAARHFLEHQGPLPKMAMMFQHYPLSWIAAWQRTYGILKSLHKAGGVKAMFQRDPKQRALHERKGKLGNTIGEKVKNLGKMSNLGYWTNTEMMFALSAGAVAAMVTGLRYGTGIVMGQFWQHPASEVAQDTIRYVQNGFNGEEEKNKSLFWSRGILNEITGPFYTDFMDAVSLAALKVGIDDGDMPRWTADLLRGTLGFRPNELLLTQFGSRRFGNAFDVMNESFLFGSMSVAPKAARLATNIPRIGDQIYDAGVGPLYEAATGGKVRRNEDPGLDDMLAALGKAAGIRDEKSIDDYLARRLKRDYSQ